MVRSSSTSAQLKEYFHINGIISKKSLVGLETHLKCQNIDVLTTLSTNMQNQDEQSLIASTEQQIFPELSISLFYKTRYPARYTLTFVGQIHWTHIVRTEV